MKPPGPLLKRIEALHAELEMLIGEYVDERSKACPNVPDVVLRKMVNDRAPGCLCRQLMKVATE